MNLAPLALPTMLVREQVTLDGQPFPFVRPANDDTIFGTLSCLNANKFHLNEIRFAPGDVVLDIGCNIGLLGLIVAKINPEVRVFGFDASDLAIRAARTNAGLNGLTNYQAYHVAIGAENRAGITFFSNGKDKSCLVEDGFNKDNKVPEVKVNKIRVDELFDSPLLGIERVKYLKIDIEGGEFEIFQRLFKDRPDILDRIDYLHLEIHPYQEYRPQELEAMVRERFKDRVFFDT